MPAKHPLRTRVVRKAGRVPIASVVDLQQGRVCEFMDDWRPIAPACIAAGRGQALDRLSTTTEGRYQPSGVVRHLANSCHSQPS